MTRQVTIDTDRILDAARAVFLKKGINAKTAEVAKRAGVSEGSIFVRFKTKQDLFRAAMNAEREQNWLEMLTEPGASNRPVPEVLLDVALAAITYFRTILPLSMMLWSNPEKAQTRSKDRGLVPPPFRNRKLLTEYLDRQAEVGRVRAGDRENIARLLMAACAQYASEETLVLQKRRKPSEDTEYVTALTALVWQLLAP